MQLNDIPNKIQYLNTLCLMYKEQDSLKKAVLERLKRFPKQSFEKAVQYVENVARQGEITSGFYTLSEYEESEVIELVWIPNKTYEQKGMHRSHLACFYKTDLSVNSVKELIETIDLKKKVQKINRNIKSIEKLVEAHNTLISKIKWHNSRMDDTFNSVFKLKIEVSR